MSNTKFIQLTGAIIEDQKLNFSLKILRNQAFLSFKILNVVNPHFPDVIPYLLLNRERMEDNRWESNEIR